MDTKRTQYIGGHDWYLDGTHAVETCPCGDHAEAIAELTTWAR